MTRHAPPPIRWPGASSVQAAQRGNTTLRPAFVHALERAPPPIRWPTSNKAPRGSAPTPVPVIALDQSRRSPPSRPMVSPPQLVQPKAGRPLLPPPPIPSTPVGKPTTIQKMRRLGGSALGSSRPLSRGLSTVRPDIHHAPFETMGTIRTTGSLPPRVKGEYNRYDKKITLSNSLTSTDASLVNEHELNHHVSSYIHRIPNQSEEEEFWNLMMDELAANVKEQILAAQWDHKESDMSDTAIRTRDLYLADPKSFVKRIVDGYAREYRLRFPNIPTRRYDQLKGEIIGEYIKGMGM